MKKKLKKHLKVLVENNVAAVKDKLKAFVGGSVGRQYRAFYGSKVVRVDRKVDGVLHSVTGPACVVNDYNMWYMRGEVHRYYGPATNWIDDGQEIVVIHSTNSNWFINGKQIT